MKATVITSTTGEMRRGNHYRADYKGTTVVYAVPVADASAWEFHVVVSRKWMADDIAAWINEGGWDGHVDPFLAWEHHIERPAVQRYADDDNAKEV